MTKQVKRIAEAAQVLSAEDLADLVDVLLLKLHDANPEIEKAWAVQGERRLDAHLRGETTARDADEVLAKHLKP